MKKPGRLPSAANWCWPVVRSSRMAARFLTMPASIAVTAGDRRWAVKSLPAPLAAWFPSPVKNRSGVLHEAGMANIYDHVISHPLSGEQIHVPFGKAGAQWSPDKIGTAARLIRAYKETVGQNDSPLKQITDTDLWTSITRDNFGEMLGFIERDDAEQLSRFLADFGSTYTWFGGITTGIDGYNHWNTDEQAVAFSYFDKLLCLAEALGVLCAENPEQGPAGNWGRNIRRDPDSVAAAIAEHLGIDIIAPQGVIPVAGIKLTNGLLHYRHINALYMAARIREFTNAPDRICEFGGGLGLVALYLHRMGRKDSTLFDIPITNVLSGWFLLGALGKDAVSLEGEPMRPGTIKIRANWNCVHTPDRHFRLTANMDSFPEINRRIFDEYVRQIKRTTTGYFLSINHEVEHAISDDARHLNVSRLLGTDSGMKRVYRAPYWIRRGYVEELYRIESSLFSSLFTTMFRR